MVAFADRANVPGMAGVILAMMSTGALFSALYYGSREWAWPLWKLFVVWEVLLTVRASTFILAPNVWMLGALMFTSGLAVAPVMTNRNTIVQRITTPSRLTEGLTWMVIAATVGRSLGSALAGPMIDSHGPAGGFAITLTFAWTMALTAVLGVRAMRRSLETADKRFHVPSGEPTQDEETEGDGPHAE